MAGALPVVQVLRKHPQPKAEGRVGGRGSLLPEEHGKDRRSCTAPQTVAPSVPAVTSRTWAREPAGTPTPTHPQRMAIIQVAEPLPACPNL